MFPSFFPKVTEKAIPNAGAYMFKSFKETELQITGGGNKSAAFHFFMRIKHLSFCQRQNIYLDFAEQAHEQKSTKKNEVITIASSGYMCCCLPHIPGPSGSR